MYSTNSGTAADSVAEISTTTTPTSPTPHVVQEASKYSNIVVDSSSHFGSGVVCKFYAAGYCNKGASCRFVHPSNVSNSSQSDSSKITKPSEKKHKERKLGVISVLKSTFGFVENSQLGTKIYFSFKNVDPSYTSLEIGDSVTYEEVTSRNAQPGRESYAINIKFFHTIQTERRIPPSDSTHVTNADSIVIRPKHRLNAPSPLEKQASESWAIISDPNPDSVAKQPGSSSTPSLSNFPKSLTPAWLEKKQSTTQSSTPEHPISPNSYQSQDSTITRSSLTSLGSVYDPSSPRNSVQSNSSTPRPYNNAGSPNPMLSRSSSGSSSTFSLPRSNSSTSQGSIPRTPSGMSQGSGPRSVSNVNGGISSNEVAPSDSISAVGQKLSASSFESQHSSSHSINTRSTSSRRSSGSSSSLGTNNFGSPLPALLEQSSISGKFSQYLSSSSPNSSSGSTVRPAPRIKKKNLTSTQLQPSTQQTSIQSSDYTSLIGGSMTSIVSHHNKFPNKTSMLRWTSTFTAEGADPTAILLQRESLEQLLRHPNVPFAVIAEILKIFAHPEFRDAGKMDRILNIIAESPFIRDPRNLRTYIIKLSNVNSANSQYEENLTNVLSVISDILDRYPEFLDRLHLDILDISQSKIQAAYTAHLFQACQELLQKGKAILDTAAQRLLQSSAVSSDSSRFFSKTGMLETPYAYVPHSVDSFDDPSFDMTGDQLVPVPEINEFCDDLPGRPFPPHTNVTETSNTTKSSKLQDFRELPLFPTIEEVFGDPELLNRRLRKNITEGRYESLMHYLETHFRLLREDAITSIRDGIRAFRTKIGNEPLNGTTQNRIVNEQLNDIAIYNDVKLCGICPSWTGIVYRVSFKLDSNSDRQVNWKKINKLLYGSLVCLSSDGFNTFLWGTIANRDENLLSINQEIDIKFAEGYQQLFDASKSYIMVESKSTYYEAYQHVLYALQHVNVHTFPFSDHLMAPTSQIEPPTYLTSLPTASLYDMKNVLDFKQLADSTISTFSLASTAAHSSKTSFDILGKWPNDDFTTSMDPSQLDALKHALTKSIAVLQGPPGTGKTFVGLKVVRSLLDNVESHVRGPILIVCFTNHALDQFLEGILQFEDAIVRIGSRSKSAELVKKNLKELVRERQVPNETARARSYLLKEINELKDTIENRFKDLSRVVVTHLELSAVAPEHQLIQLFGKDGNNESHAVNALSDWLGMKPQELVKVNLQKLNDQSPSLDAASINPTISSSFENKDDVEDEEDLQGYASDELDNDADLDMEIEGTPGYSDNWTFVPKMASLEKDIFSAQSDMLKQQASNNRYCSDALELLTPPSQQTIMSENIWKLSIFERRQLYIHWLRNMRTTIISNDLSSMCDKYEELCKQKKVLDQDSQVQVLMNAAVIGMTTTGVAKFQNLVKAVAPAIVVVEEAAEVLEAHIISSLTPGTKHLILIGDHEQLRPTTAVYRLALKYSLDVSLFERLIRNGSEVKTLATQRRMRPDISELIIPIYPQLNNHPHVLGYPNVAGVTKNLYFIDHRHPESIYEDASSSVAKSTSRTNIHEAKFLARFVSYLLFQNYLPNQITVLSAYAGQVKLIRQELASMRLQVYVTTVDNYQGQENDIICLSLVRSNAKNQLGFLNSSNRICVALSRAKIGLYIIGNSSLILNSGNQLWPTIICNLQRNEAIGTHVVVQCQKHPQKQTALSEVGDFSKVEHGGCDVACKEVLECGHVCPLFCHPYDHSLVCCRVPCEKIQPCGHRCSRLCFEDCGDCIVPFTKLLECGHQIEYPCCEQASPPPCSAVVTASLPCGHSVDVLCRDIHHTKKKTWTCPVCSKTKVR